MIPNNISTIKNEYNKNRSQKYIRSSVSPEISFGDTARAWPNQNPMANITSVTCP
jgi:hypothetical protein